MKEAATTNKCTYVAGHFDSHGGVMVQYRQHHPMQHVQDYIRSHWTPPSGDYSLCIAPAGARATANKTINKMYSLCWPFWWPWRCTGPYRTRRLMEEVQDFHKSHYTKRCHQASTHSDRHQSDMPTPILGVYFILKLLKKGSSCPSNNMGMTHQSDEKHLNNMAEYFVGVVNIAF